METRRSLNTAGFSIFSLRGQSAQSSAPGHAFHMPPAQDTGCLRPSLTAGMSAINTDTSFLSPLLLFLLLHLLSHAHIYTLLDYAIIHIHISLLFSLALLIAFQINISILNRDYFINSFHWHFHYYYYFTHFHWYFHYWTPLILFHFINISLLTYSRIDIYIASYAIIAYFHCFHYIAISLHWILDIISFSYYWSQPLHLLFTLNSRQLIIHFHYYYFNISSLLFILISIDTH